MRCSIVPTGEIVGVSISSLSKGTWTLTLILTHSFGAAGKASHTITRRPGKPRNVSTIWLPYHARTLG
jgi:hypothetical protein